MAVAKKCCHFPVHKLECFYTESRRNEAFPTYGSDWHSKMDNKTQDVSPESRIVPPHKGTSSGLPPGTGWSRCIPSSTKPRTPFRRPIFSSWHCPHRNPHRGKIAGREERSQGMLKTYYPFMLHISTITRNSSYRAISALEGQPKPKIERCWILRTLPMVYVW